MKETLLENLHKSLSLTNLNDAAARELYSLKEPTWMIFGKGPFMIASYIVFTQLLKPFGINMFLRWITSFFVAIIGVIFILSYIQRKRIESNQEKINDLENAQRHYEKLLGENSIVPANYRGTNCIMVLIYYLQTGRADTLKEALNLYETEKRHKEMMVEINRMNQMNADLEKQMQQTKQSAEWAEIAATVSLMKK